MNISIPDCLRPDAVHGAKLLQDIEATAVKLSCLMAEAHGGQWRTQIDHDAEGQFIMIARRLRT